ncbi:MAG TPA: guanine deaminase [Solirubrobacteraceae bacterium]|nr:guanine deaminase [Solirubrobacteraceae bacterium]
MTTIVRAQILHTPRDPFVHGGAALEAFSDGGLAFGDDGRIAATGSFADVRAAHPGAEVHDASDAVLLPGLVDLHVHYPQVAVIGAMGMTLLEWLATRTLPEEARLADTAYAEDVARLFVRGLVRNGTTTALVFGSHFAAAQEALFAEAERSGLRIASGLVVSDQNLMAVLHTSPDDAYAQSRGLIERWHGRGRLRYAVTPRFSLSCTDAMLESCGALVADGPADLLFTSHINENPAEIQAVAELFPWSRDYLHTYERFGLVGRGSVVAHDVHVSDDELRRLSAADASVAHCPSSNAFLASGIFPMARHCAHGVRFGLGTDVGAGTGLSLFKEALMAYHVQMVREGGQLIGPAHLLHLATRAGADALGLGDEIGDLCPGRSADFVLVRAPEDSTLAAVLRSSPSADATLGALFTLAREDAVAEVRVAGERIVYGDAAPLPAG